MINILTILLFIKITSLQKYRTYDKYNTVYTFAQFSNKISLVQYAVYKYINADSSRFARYLLSLCVHEQHLERLLDEIHGATKTMRKRDETIYGSRVVTRYSVGLQARRCKQSTSRLV